MELVSVLSVLPIPPFIYYLLEGIAKKSRLPPDFFSRPNPRIHPPDHNGVDYATRMNLYNLIFRMVILIPFLTQPPHERTLTGRGSRVYPNVGAAGCTIP